MFFGIVFICLAGAAIAQSPPAAMLRKCAEEISVTPNELFSLKASEAFAGMNASTTPDDVINIINATMSETLGWERTVQFFTCIKDFIAEKFTECSTEAGVTDEQEESVKTVLQNSFDQFKTMTKEEAEAAKGDMQKQIMDVLGEETATKLQTCIEAKFQGPPE